jgi:glycosyltransferase involved in cell wall biosynthesis
VAGSPRPAGEPLISVILAVRGVAEYLPGCLDSILGQPDPPAGIEVIAVDDASPDGCGAILDTRAAADPRLRVIHLPEQGGPGPGRMRGLAEAAGVHVWFADPRMAADVRGYRPPGYRRPPGLRGLKTALICRDAYRTYAMLAPVNNARVAARRVLAGAG